MGQFQGKTVVFTGSLPTVDRLLAETLVKEAGGKVSSTVSDKIDFIVVGENPGMRLLTAWNLGIKQLNEDEFMEMFQ